MDHLYQKQPLNQLSHNNAHLLILVIVEKFARQCSS